MGQYRVSPGKPMALFLSLSLSLSQILSSSLTMQAYGVALGMQHAVYPQGVVRIITLEFSELTEGFC